MLQYLPGRGELSDRQAFFKVIDTQISHEVGEKIVSLAEQLKEEGRIEGEFNKEREIAKRMLDDCKSSGISNCHSRKKIK